MRVSSYTLDDELVRRVNDYAAQMSATRSWSVRRLLRIALAIEAVRTTEGTRAPLATETAR